jgi:hypothetical protein
MSRDDVHDELTDVLNGRERTSDEIFVFDSTGTALQDVAVASLALRRALESVWRPRSRSESRARNRVRDRAAETESGEDALRVRHLHPSSR